MSPWEFPDPLCYPHEWFQHEHDITRPSWFQPSIPDFRNPNGKNGPQESLVRPFINVDDSCMNLKPAGFSEYNCPFPSCLCYCPFLMQPYDCILRLFKSNYWSLHLIFKNLFKKTFPSKVKVKNFKLRSSSFASWLIQVIDKLRTQDIEQVKNVFLWEKRWSIGRKEEKAPFPRQDYCIPEKMGEEPPHYVE